MMAKSEKVNPCSVGTYQSGAVCRKHAWQHAKSSEVLEPMSRVQVKQTSMADQLELKKIANVRGESGKSILGKVNAVLETKRY